MHALIATDGSPVSIEAARKGVEMLNPDRVTLVTVADTSITEDSGAGGFEGNLLSVDEAQEARGSIIETGRDELQATAAAIGLDASKMEMKLLEGSAGPAICAAAEEFTPDVVVVGSHGRGWFQRLVIGSISEYVARHCMTPVLIVRPESDEDKD